MFVRTKNWNGKSEPTSTGIWNGRKTSKNPLKNVMPLLCEYQKQKRNRKAAVFDE